MPKQTSHQIFQGVCMCTSERKLWLQPICLRPFMHFLMEKELLLQVLEASGSQSGFFADFYFWKILEQTKGSLWALRCHNGRSHALLNCLCLAAIVWHAVCSRQRKWSRDPSRDRPLGRSRFFRRFCAHFCVTLEHLFLKRQNVKEKSAKNLRKNPRIAHEKSAQKSAHQICAKNLRKNLRINQRTKISAKNRTTNRCDDFLSLEDESQKKTQKKSAPHMCKNPAPTSTSEKWVSSILASCSQLAWDQSCPWSRNEHGF